METEGEQPLECTIPIRVKRVSVLSRYGHRDQIMLELSDAMSRRIRGLSYEDDGGIALTYSVKRGRAADALHMLGLCSDLPVSWYEDGEGKEFTMADI